jgi:hypothetical protein
MRPGLQALGARSAQVSVSAPGSATHSIDLDAALRAQYPSAARWDYGVNLKIGSSNTIAWIEVHHATSGEVGAVLNKLAWLKQWLNSAQDACCTSKTKSTFHWVATPAGVHIDTQRLRRLASAGLKAPQARLRLPSR